ncbi:hypothetical protein E2C01_089365 [Portunus trituberculatus]|uniref:Uncharacterized protein n=1 Tax=Portunus trituberculatus TaxID=210409 RepID=A0A5B7JH04_PORTR|nr:hypothetical protein [Portunus trituberculatus]
MKEEAAAVTGQSSRRAGEQKEG